MKPFADAIAKLIGKGDGGGGITQNISISSPKPLSPSETKSKLLQASRQLAMEWGG